MSSPAHVVAGSVTVTAAQPLQRSAHWNAVRLPCSVMICGYATAPWFTAVSAIWLRSARGRELRMSLFEKSNRRQFLRGAQVEPMTRPAGWHAEPLAEGRGEAIHTRPLHVQAHTPF
jgi:hypothetical protein